MGGEPANPDGAGKVGSNGMNADTWPCWRCDVPLLLERGAPSAALCCDPSMEEAAAAAHAAAAIAAVLQRKKELFFRSNKLKLEAENVA